MLDIEIIDFTEENTRLLEDNFFNDEYDKRIFRNISWNLWNLADNSGYIFVEDDYIDRDFSEDFSQFFSTTYANFDKRCTRIHFFKCFGDNQKELTWPIDIEDHEKLQNSYLGFIVILPISQKGNIGRTVVRPFPMTGMESYCCTNTKTSVNILGMPLVAHGMPFKEQDGRIGVCATVAMWIVARYMHLEFGLTRYSPSEITRAANKFLRINREFPANRGLQVEQMVSGFVELGYSPLVYDKATFTPGEWNPKEIIYKYIESGIPAIIITEHGNSLHASVVIGHDIVSEKTVDTNKWLVSNSVLMGNFLVHDDSYGPYLRLPDKDPLVTPNSTSDKPLNDLSPFEIPQNRYTPYTLCDVDKIIVPSFKKVYLEGQDVEILIEDLFSIGKSDFLTRYEETISLISIDKRLELVEANMFDEATINYAQRMHEKIIKQKTHIFYRAHIVRSNIFKEKYLFSDEIPKALGELYGGLSMSRYIWVVELALEQDVNMTETSEDQCPVRKIFGEVIIDSTGAIELDSVISIHVPGLLMTTPLYDFDPDNENPDSEDPDSEPNNDYTLYPVIGDKPYTVLGKERII